MAPPSTNTGTHTRNARCRQAIRTKKLQSRSVLPPPAELGTNGVEVGEGGEGGDETGKQGAVTFANCADVLVDVDTYLAATPAPNPDTSISIPASIEMSMASLNLDLDSTTTANHNGSATRRHKAQRLQDLNKLDKLERKRVLAAGPSIDGMKTWYAATGHRESGWGEEKRGITHRHERQLGWMKDLGILPEEADLRDIKR